MSDFIPFAVIFLPAYSIISPLCGAFDTDVAI